MWDTARKNKHRNDVSNVRKYICVWVVACICGIAHDITAQGSEACGQLDRCLVWMGPVKKSREP